MSFIGKLNTTFSNQNKFAWAEMWSKIVELSKRKKTTLLVFEVNPSEADDFINYTKSYGESNNHDK